MSRTVMDYIKDLTDKKVHHDYDTELACIEAMLDEHDCRMKQKFENEMSNLRRENERLQVIIGVMADHVQLLEGKTNENT